MNRRDVMKATAITALAPGLIGATAAHADGHGGAQTLPVVRSHTIGDAKVWAISDGYLPIGPDILNGIEAEEFAERLAAAHEPGPASLTGVNAYLLEIEGEKILLDAGTGTIMGDTLGHLAPALDALGVAPADITKVVATHLHPDHVGGLLVDGANPFTNAALVVSADDVAFWTNEEIASGAPEDFQPFFQLASGVVQSFGDRVETVTGEAALAPGLTAMPMPGHTPGHMGAMLERDGQSLLFWADIIHVGPVQFARPEVTIAFDADAAVASATRASVLDMAATDGLRVAGAHIDFPGIGYVERRDTGYAWIADGYPYGE